MAKVKIQGHASGTGILTVTAPNTSTDRTITLPDATGTLATTADVFDPDGKVTINESGADVDFRVETDTNANALIVNGGANKIGMGMDVDSNDANLTIYTAGDTSTTSDKIMFKSAFGNGGKHGISWKDASNIVARISAEYESSPGTVDTVFSSQYNGAYKADTVETLRITGDGRGLSQFTAKAWADFDQATVNDSHNVSSVTDNGTGDFSINYTNNMASVNYAASGLAETAGNVSVWAQAVGSLRIRTDNSASGAYTDYPAAVIVFGD